MSQAWFITIFFESYDAISSLLDFFRPRQRSKRDFKPVQHILANFRKQVFLPIFSGKEQAYSAFSKERI